MAQPGRAREDTISGYLFIAPATILIAAFGVFPIGFTVVVSLFRWRIKPGRFIGLANYTALFGSLLWPLVFGASLVAIYFALRFLVDRGRGGHAWFPHLLWWCIGLGGLLGVVFSLPRLWSQGDSDAIDSLRVTIFYSLGTVPVQLVLGLLVAFLLNHRIKGKQFFRVAALLPYIVPTIASAAVFTVLFSLRPESLANEVLALFGIRPLSWLGERRGILTMLFGWGAQIVVDPASVPSASLIPTYWATWVQGPSLGLVSIMLYNHWVYTGYYALIYTNGLAGIPRQLYEAAEVDGAGKVSAFFRITLPLLSPTTYFLTMLGIIGTFKSFNSVYIMAQPGAGTTVDTLSLSIFNIFFGRSTFGYAAAESLFLFVLVVGLTYVQRHFLERRVHYGE